MIQFISEFNLGYKMYRDLMKFSRKIARVFRNVKAINDISAIIPTNIVPASHITHVNHISRVMNPQYPSAFGILTEIATAVSMSGCRYYIFIEFNKNSDMDIHLHIGLIFYMHFRLLSNVFRNSRFSLTYTPTILSIIWKYKNILNANFFFLTVDSGIQATQVQADG